MSTFPNGIFNWTTVYDGVSIDYAEGDNSIASDLIAVETTLGTNPQTEPSPAAGGSAQTFPSVGARITSVQQGQQLPVAQLTAQTLVVNNSQGAGTNYGVWNTYAVSYDPYNMYNGTDITVPASGWYRVVAGEAWDWWSTGYVMQSLYINNVQVDQDIWLWDFTGNVRFGAWQAPQPNLPGPVQRPGFTKVEWEGQIPAGQRIRVLSENGTPDAQHTARNTWLSVSMLRTT